PTQPVTVQSNSSLTTTPSLMIRHTGTTCSPITSAAGNRSSNWKLPVLPQKECGGWMVRNWGMGFMLGGIVFTTLHVPQNNYPLSLYFSLILLFGHASQNRFTAITLQTIPSSTRLIKTRADPISLARPASS